MSKAPLPHLPQFDTIGDSWPCCICEEWRPDHLISVKRTRFRNHLKGLSNPIGTYLRERLGNAMQMNVRYCNDRPECVEAVPAYIEERWKKLEQFLIGRYGGGL